MANLASSGVEILDSWEEDGLNGKKFIGRRVRLTLTAMGTTTNKIQASVLKLGSLVSSSPAIEADNSEIRPTAPSYDGSLLLIGGGASNAPADVTGVFDLTVRGVRTV